MSPSMPIQLCALFAGIAIVAAADAGVPTDSQFGAIHGVVRINGNVPAKYANIVIAAARRGAEADEHGFFRINRLPAGIHVVLVALVGLPITSDTLQVAAGVDRELDLELTNPFLLKGSPHDHLDTFDLVGDCAGDSRPTNHRLPRMQASSGENASGHYGLRADKARPWELRIAYRRAVPRGALSIQVLDESGRVVRRLRNISGGTAGNLTWDGRGDDSQLLMPGKHRIQFATAADTLELPVCVQQANEHPVVVGG